MKWYKHLLFYFISCAFLEFVLLMLFAISTITENDNSVWVNKFYILQIGIPIFGAFLWLLMEMVFDYVEKLRKEGEWLEKLNERLKDYKKKKGGTENDLSTN